MYVLADLEWVEDKNSRISFTQIAMLRVDENWKAVGNIFRRIRPMDPSFYQWKHVAFTGGSIPDFLNAQNKADAFSDIANWLSPYDIICWWHPESKEWVQKFVPTITNEQIVLTELVASYLVDGGRGSPYRIGKELCLDRPKAKHDSRNDVEMMRRVLEHIRFPQPIPEHVSRIIDHIRSGIYDMAYHAHIDTNTIHKNGCPYIPETGVMKGYNELIKPVSKGYVPCDCIKAEFRAARKQRNQNIIDRTEYNFLYTTASKVFHRRDCKSMLSAKDVLGTIRYVSCLDTGRQPCKICNPTYEDEAHIFMRSTKKVVTTQPKAGKLSLDEQRAVSRHRQALEQRKAVERNAALTQEKREDFYTLSKPGYAFFAAKGYTNFHLRNCKKLSGVSNVEGFAWYKDAVRAGYSPCKCCKPSAKHDVVVSMPIYSTERNGESAETLKGMCARFGYRYWEKEGLSYIETEIGIWRLRIDVSPYRLDHINRVVNPDNTKDFHRQPRLFLSLCDTIYYIKRHDEGLTLSWQNTEYVPTEI